MSSVYCGACGAGLSESARFCRACGSAQAEVSSPPPPPQAPPLPLPPPVVAASSGATAPAVGAAAAGGAALPAPPRLQDTTAAPPIAATLSILGGLGICFYALYTTIYLPLHFDYPVNYGEGPRLIDLLALGSGMAAIAIGAMALRGRLRNRVAAGVALAAAGLPLFFLAVLWIFPTTFNLESYSDSPYYGHVFFSDIGYVELGSRYVPIGLLAACVAVATAGLLMATGREPAPQQGPGRR